MSRRIVVGGVVYGAVYEGHGGTPAQPWQQYRLYRHADQTPLGRCWHWRVGTAYYYSYARPPLPRGIYPHSLRTVIRALVARQEIAR